MSSIDKQEIENFSKDSSHWWDENGPFKPLHRLNPTRVAYIKEQICTHFGKDQQSLKALKGLKILDVGCGGGLICEPMARMGADISGVDADSNAIQVAIDHASAQDIKINYHCDAVENLTEQYDVVLALEIIEHVQDPAQFVEDVCARVKKGGLVIFSTLNRNPKSFLLGVVAAEYILRWVPKGTHSWKKFIQPSELSRYLRNAGAKPCDISGLIFNPIKREFALSSSDLDVNYLITSKL